jgi:NADPH:quinone reductase-like Zn-dependent oxidoreductase
MAVNRAVQPTKGQGDPLENYVLSSLPKPTASAKNVVVKVLLRPVNPTDLLTSRWGTWANLDLKSVVVGSEGMGVIEEVCSMLTVSKRSSISSLSL